MQHLGAYVILYIGVAASWIGIPIVGAGVLGAAGVLASQGELNIWAVIVVSAFASWTGGYVGYSVGLRVGKAVAGHEGRWQRQRWRAMSTGEHIYRRWGRLGVFITPTWVSGALRMPRNRFLLWNGFAAIVSTCLAVLAAYGIGAAVFDQIKARSWEIGVAAAGFALIAVAVAVWRHHRATEDGRQSSSYLFSPDQADHRRPPKPRDDQERSAAADRSGV